MKSTTRPTINVLAPVLAFVAFQAGCAELVNPWADDLPDEGAVTTASVEGIRAAQPPPAPRDRGLERDVVKPQGGTVSHWPLYWEDPFVDKGSEDGRDAWTQEDYWAFVYGFGRFLLNTMGFPVSAAVTPPWTVMGSDGQISRQCFGYDHDAERRPGGVMPPIDVLEVGIAPGTNNNNRSAPSEPLKPEPPA